MGGKQIVVIGASVAAAIAEGFFIGSGAEVILIDEHIPEHPGDWSKPVQMEPLFRPIRKGRTTARGGNSNDWKDRRG